MNAHQPTRRTPRIAVVGAALAILMLAFAAAAQAGETTNKVTICHANSGINEFVVITIDEGASAFPHLDDNGSPLNGHEDDFLLQGEATAQDCYDAAHPTPTPTPTPTPEEPTPTPTPEGSQAGGTGTPEASLQDSATSLPGLAGPLATVVFGLVLLGSLGALAYANVSAVRRRS